VRTRNLQLVTQEHSDTVSVRSGASSPFGPVNPASTTLRVQEIYRANQLVQLSELLNSLERVIESLNYKSFTVYDTLNTAIEEVRAALLPTQIDEAGTEVLN
jgi:hypothetical protein